MKDIKSTFEVNLFKPIRETQSSVHLLKAAGDASYPGITSC
jgi:hypothetical protein